MSILKSLFSVALSAALLLMSVLAVPASATHIAGLPDDPLGCIVDPVDPLSCLPDPLGGGLPDPLGGGLPGLPVVPELPGTPALPETPALPGTPAPPATPPVVEAPTIDAKPTPKDSKPSPPKRTAPPSKPVILEPTDGRTTGTGNFRPGSGSGGKSANARSAKSGIGRSTASFGIGAFNRLAPRSTGAVTRDKRANARSFASQVIQRIPEQYRWPVFVLACLATFFALNTMRERFRSIRAEGRALTDSLTRLPNRAAFERRLAKEYRRADRYDRPLSMLLLDLDGFKQINDTQGHAAGDDALRKAAAAIASRIRRGDMAARLGGDEFVVLCPETSIEGAKDLARSLEEGLAEVSIRTSVGYAERETEDDGLPEYLVARADASMYTHKQRSGGTERRSHAITAEPLAGMAGAA